MTACTTALTGEPQHGDAQQHPAHQLNDLVLKVCVCVCVLQVLHTLEGVGVVVFPELRPALFPAGGAVAGGLGVHPFTGQPGRTAGLLRGALQTLLLETSQQSRYSTFSVPLHLLLCSVSQPGSSLEQTHIFVLAHILRRPIIVYGVKYYKSFRGETLGYTRFQGEPAAGLEFRQRATLFQSARMSLCGKSLSA